jgi:alpha-mannosidase
LRNTGIVPPKQIAARINEITEPAKIGDTFGKSWDTHWFLINIEIPEEWLADEKEVHLIWNGKCEASLYPTDGSKLLTAFTENVRERYVIKRQGIKNDLTDETVNKSESKNKISYLIESACNEMFGNFEAGFNT